MEGFKCDDFLPRKKPGTKRFTRPFGSQPDTHEDFARWLQQLFPFDIPVDQAAQVLTATGFEVEGVEHVQDVPGGLEGVVVGVVSVEPHPNADRLRLCKVDVEGC